jgi:hypothetical protein
MFFFPFAARDRRRKLHKEFFFFFPRGRFCAFGFRDSWRWSQVRRFACGRDGWNVRPARWMTVRAGGVRGCFTKSLHISNVSYSNSRKWRHDKMHMKVLYEFWFWFKKLVWDLDSDFKLWFELDPQCEWYFEYHVCTLKMGMFHRSACM